MKSISITSILIVLLNCSCLVPELKQTNNLKRNYCRALLLSEIDSLEVVNGDLEIHHENSKRLIVMVSPGNNKNGGSQNLSLILNSDNSSSSDSSIGVNVYHLVKFDEKNAFFEYTHQGIDSARILSTEIDTGSFILNLNYKSSL